MPIEINYAPNAQLGPGFLLTWRETGPGPWPTDTHWNIQWLANVEDGSGPVVGNFPSGDPNLPFTATLFFQTDHWNALVPNAGISHGKANYVYIRLISQEFGTVAEQRFPVTTDLVSGLQMVVSQQGSGTGGGGFTEPDRIVLQSIQWWMLWDLAGELLPELIDLLRNAVRSKPDTVLIEPDAVGEGHINPPVTGALFKWVGLKWALVGWPEGIGVDEGNPDQLEINYMQISRLESDSANIAWVEESFYERRLEGQWDWGLDEPARMHWYVMPGCTVRFWYLIQRDPSAAAGASSSPTPAVIE